MRSLRPSGTDKRDSWNPPAELFPDPVKSTHSSPPSAVSMVGWVEDLQEENQISDIMPGFLTERVWEQFGGREREGRIKRRLSLFPGSTFQWQLI